MSQKYPASMNQLWHQSHVAQQSRRDKLRIPGSQHHLSSQSCGQIEPSSHATAAHLDPSTGYLQGYPTHIGQSNGGNVFPAYSIYMISSDPYNIPTDVELLASPAKNTGHLQADSAPQSPFVGTTCSGPVTPISFNSLSNAPQFGMMNKNAFLNAPLSVNVTATAVTSAVAANLLASPSIQTSTFGLNGREGSMATYFPSSNIQGDTMQTLYLMNPTVAGYADSIASGNMVLVNNSIGTALATSNFAGNAESQQHFIGISLPAASPSQRSSVGGVENSPAEQQSVTSNLLTSRLGGHTYNSWQGGGNELTFLQTTDAASSNQSLCGQLNDSVSLGLQSVAEISQLGMRHTSMSSVEEQQSGMLPSGLGLQPDQPHGSTGHGRGLSLSLSPQQPSTVQLPSFQNQPAELDMNCPGIPRTTSEENMHGIDRTTNKWMGSLSSVQVSSRDWMMGTGFSNSVHSPAASKQLQLDLSSTGAAGFATVLRDSKYLKAAQELLDEVVNIGNGVNPDSAKHHKPQTRIGAVVDRESIGIQAGGKDGVPDARTGIATSAEEINEHVTELTVAERQELQMRKAKLVAMVDEVDRRYRQYYHQMQIVVSSFEAATEFGAAKTYTALALQTISRHFRCLRDAITGQIRMTSKSLGEEDMKGSGKGETSCLRFVDQHLRQQRALQQLGMIQQHAWRPQRGLPERSVSVLRAWLFEHFLHPYPKDADKHMLARQAGLTRSQVSNWFINARVRLWKPMVEEMYMEEIKEAEIYATAKASKENGEIKEDTESMEGAGNSQNGQEQKHAKAVHLNNHVQNVGCVQQNGASSAGLKFDHSSDKTDGRNQAFNMDGTSDDEAFHEVQKGVAMQGHLKKARNGIQDSTYLLSPNMDVDFKSDETCLEDVCDDSKFSDERHSSEEYSLVHGGMVHADKSGSLGSYQISSLGRYDQDSFTPSFSGSGGVSLTLGLQHSDGLSLSATQQSCISSQGSKFDLRSASDDYCNINETAATHAANAYESINTHNRKRFATHLLHDFVA